MVRHARPVGDMFLASPLKNKLVLIALGCSIAANVYFWVLLNAGGTSQQTQFDVNRQASVARTSEPATNSPANPNPGWAQLNDDLNYLFDGGEYRLALAGAAAAGSYFPRKSSALIEQWYLQIIRVLQQNKSASTLAAAESLLDAGAGRYYTRTYHQWLLAEYRLATGNILEALDLFIEIKRNAESVYRERVAKRLDEWLSAFFEKKYQDLDWNNGLAITERLLWHNPGDGDSLLIQADMQIQQQRYQEAQTSLSNASTISGYEEKANRMLERVRLLQVRDISVPLVSAGNNQYLVDVSIVAAQNQPENTAKLLLDTGASLTVITKKFFQRIDGPENAVLIRNGVMNTAGGAVAAPIYRVARLSIGEYTLHDIEVVVMDYPSGSSDGLLGMNFLGRYEFEIDQDNDWLLLSPRN